MKRGGFSKPARPPRDLTGAAIALRRPATPSRAVMATRLDEAVPVTIEKDETFRSEAWLAAVRSIPCVHCGMPGEAAHVNHIDKGWHKKAPDCLTASLCREEHMRIDQGNDLARDERRALMSHYVLLTVRELARRGILIVRTK
jgi:hypothetical protein